MSEERCGFQINDVVRYGDKQGVVVFIDEFIHVSFDGIANNCLFHRDGFYDGTCRLFNLQKLELVERPKKKVKKKFWQWRVYNANLSGAFWHRDTGYISEDGFYSNGAKANWLLGYEKQKIENDFIELDWEE